MIYLGNGMWSDSGPNLSHGGPWRDHKYIKIVNGRYIYPGDGEPKRRSKKYTDSVTNQGPSTAEKAQSYVYNPYFKNPSWSPNYEDTLRKSKNVDMGESHESEYKKHFNMEKDYFGKLYPNNPIAKYGFAALNASHTQAEDMFKKGVDKAEDKIQELKDKKKYGKLYGTIKVTEPSAAQKAQSENGASGYSKNVKGYDSMQSKAYRAKYGQFRIANGGPSTAELAQRNKEFDKNSNAYKAKYGEMGKANGGPSAAELAQRGGAPKSTSSKPKAPAEPTRPTRSVTKYAKRPDGNNPRDPMGLGGNHKIGNMGNGKKGRGAKTTGSDQRLNSNKKYQKAVSSQGPSQAELAQRGMMKGSSKNVSTGSKTVQYQKQLTDSNKKYQKAVSSQGPSAAELAQREKGSKKKPKSKNVNSGKPNKKKKNPFKELAKWIKGSEGKVSVKK